MLLTSNVFALLGLVRREDTRVTNGAESIQPENLKLKNVTVIVG